MSTTTELGNGKGTFTSTAPNVGVRNQPQSIAVGFFNADSFLDLVVPNQADDEVYRAVLRMNIFNYFFYCSFS